VLTVNVDRSTVNGQWSRGVHGQWVPRVSLDLRADRWAPRVRPEKEKEKGLGQVVGLKELGRLVRPNRLGSARGSAWSAAQQAGSGSGLAGHLGP
jgi:hypothetical protein